MSHAAAKRKALALLARADQYQLDSLSDEDETRENCRARLGRLAQTDAFLVLALMGA